jgi:GDP-L-fucose synthase
MNKTSKIFVAGHKGLVGSAIVRQLKNLGYVNIITKSRQELNLLRQTEVEDFFETERPEYVFDAAAKVGGIYANDNYSADFIYENIQIQTNLIHNAWKNGTKKFLLLGIGLHLSKICASSCKRN